MKRICVFCGSSPGRLPEYSRAAENFGRAMNRSGIGLVYGGAKVGLMGRLADTVIAAGGEAIGVMPRALAEKEIAHEGLTELRIVESMHERKAVMAELADGFVALPGGLGTLEEFFEAVTWAQLSIHDKPCGLLNVAGFFDGLHSFLDHAVDHRFVRAGHRSMILSSDDPENLLASLQAFTPPEIDKAEWILKVNRAIEGEK